jgi:hypothetical protein
MFRKEITTSIRLLTAASVITGCSLRHASNPAPTITEPIAITASPPDFFTYDQLPDITATNLPVYRTPTPESTITPIPTATQTPEPSPTPIIPYELPGGIRLDQENSPITMTITLKDGTAITSNFTFRTDKTGATITTLCPPGDNTVCTYFAPNEQRAFLLPHSGYINQRPLEAEALRAYIEGTEPNLYSPDVVAQKIATLPGAVYTLTTVNGTYNGNISFVVRLAPDQVEEFTYNFVIGPEKAAEFFPDQKTTILSPQDLYVQTCGHLLEGETLVPGQHYYDAARILIGVK